LPITYFDINNIAFEVLGYSVSYVELIGTLFGFISVYFASRANILTWSTGIINELFLFLLFFQVQLYADMFLQLYFFVVTIYGWRNWKLNNTSNSISTLNLNSRLKISAVLIVASFILGYVFSKIHLFMPAFFKSPSSYPYTDSLVMVLSITATILLARKKVETWYLWILVDAICIFLFLKKGVGFLALEYFLFLGLVTYGLLNWKKQLKHA
jgi:nicotinamide mononucleotide transporter